MISTEEIVLSGCLTNNIGAISTKVLPVYFEEPFYQKMFDKAVQFYVSNQVPISKSAFEKAFEDADTELKLRLEIILSQVSEDVDQALILQSCDNIKTDYQTRSIQDMSRDMLNDPDKAPEAILEKIKSRIVEVQSMVDTGRKIHDLTSEESSLRRDERVDTHSDKSLNIRWGTGVKEIDEWTKGGTPKQLWTIAAVSKHGKSTFLYNVAHDLVFIQGLNVLYVDAEMGLDLVETRLHLLHAAKVIGIMGVDSRQFIGGDCSSSMYAHIKKAGQDMSSGNDKYGQLFFMEASGMSVVDVHMKAEQLNKKHKISAIIIDYASKLKPYRDRGGNENQEVADTFKYLEQIKLGFNQGEGMWVLTGSQINKDGQKYAADSKKGKGQFQQYHLMGASETMNASDVVMGLFKANELQSKDGTSASETELLVSFIKNRIGGPTTAGDDPFTVEANWQEGRLCDFEGDKENGIDFDKSDDRICEEDDILNEEDAI